MAVANRYDRSNDYGGMTWERQEEVRQLASLYGAANLPPLKDGEADCSACGVEQPKEQMVKWDDMEWFCTDCDYQMRRA